MNRPHDDARMAGEPPLWLVALLVVFEMVFVTASMTITHARIAQREADRIQMVMRSGDAGR